MLKLRLFARMILIFILILSFFSITLFDTALASIKPILYDSLLPVTDGLGALQSPIEKYPVAQLPLRLVSFDVLPNSAQIPTTVPNYIWPVDIFALDIIEGGTDNVNQYASGISGNLIVGNQKNVWLSLETSGAPVTPIDIFAPLGMLPPEGFATYEADFTLVGQATMVTAKYDLKALVWNASMSAVGLIPGSSDLSDSEIVQVLELVDDLPQIQCAANEFIQIEDWGIESLSHLFEGSNCLVELADSDDFVNILLDVGLDVSKDKLKEYLVVWDIYQEGKKIFDTIFVIIDAPNGISINFEAHYNPLNPPPVPPPHPPIPTPSPELDQATFINDVTLPDGSVVPPSQTLIKTWRLRNAGSTTWGTGYQLVFLRGDQMGAPSSIDVPVTAPGQEVDLSVNIVAPTVGGDFAGYWRLRNPQGTYFGPEIWVKITVQDGSAPPPSSDGWELICTNCPSSVEPGTTFLPILRATVGSGQLIESRGDMVRNTDNNLYGAFPHVAVNGTVNVGQSYDFTFYAEHPITAPTTSGTYQSKWRLWQNGQYAGPELIIEFQVQPGGGTNHAPNPPLLTSPGDWAVYDGSAPSLQAQQNGDPDGDAVTGYYFEIFDSHDTPNSGWITSNSWNPPGLGYYGYQWRVKVRDGHGSESGWSEVRHFNLRNPTPQIYDFHWEWCRDAWGGPEKICFCAQTSGGGLELKLNSANDGSESGTWKVIGHGDTNLNCNTDNDRPPNWGQLEVPAGLYRVRLYQRPNVGGWDNATTADVIVTLPANQRPGTPEGLFPLLNSYLGTKTIDFQWKTTYRTDYYHFLAASDAGFTNIIVDQANILPNITTLHHVFDQDYPTVYWKVISTGPYGTNDWGGQFHIDLTPSTSVITSLPAISFDNQFTVNWFGGDERSGLRWYHIQVRDGNRPDSQWMDWLVNTTKTAEIFQGQVGHTYYFRVRSMDNVGNWENWPEGDGDTFTMIDPSSTPPAPWWNNSYTFKRSLVVLNNDSDWIPPHYPLHLRFDSTTTPTSAELYNASLSATKGNDVRVVYNNISELNRFVQRFTATQIDIWFPLQMGLGGGATDNSSYQLYYGNAGAGVPPADINTVFLPEADGNTMGLWHFQDGSGSTVMDTSGRNNSGTFYSAAWSDGNMGWAGFFDGVNAYVDVGNSNDFNLADSPMTLEAWIYLTSRGDFPHVISKWGEGDGSYLFRLLGGHSLHFLTRGGGEVGSGAIIELNRWYHLAATYDGSNTMRVFVNGVQQGIRTDAHDGLASTRRLFIGWAEGGADGGHFPGYIQHVRISNIERTDFPYARIDVVPSAVAGVQQTPPVVGNPDLALLDLTTYPNPGGGLLVQAVFMNQSDIAIQNGFFTDLYLNQVPTGPGVYAGSLQFWVNEPIAAGTTVTVTTVVADLSLLSAQSISAPGSETTATLYAQVDSTGSVTEVDDANNIHSAGTEICLASADAYEGDNTAATASAIGSGQAQQHNFDALGDQDWVKFTAEAGKTYNLRTSDLGAGADTYLYLYGSDAATLLASNDDYGGTLASQIEWVAPASGTYYILVQHWNPNVGGCGTSYRLTLNGYEIFLPLLKR